MKPTLTYGATQPNIRRPADQETLSERRLQNGRGSTRWPLAASGERTAGAAKDPQDMASGLRELAAAAEALADTLDRHRVGA